MCNGAPSTVEKMLYKDSVCSNGSKFLPFKAGGAEMGIALLPPQWCTFSPFMSMSVVFNDVLNNVTEL